MHLGDSDDYRQRAEEELRLAHSSSHEDVRREHFLQAALYFNHAYGGDPRPEGATGYTY